MTVLLLGRHEIEERLSRMLRVSRCYESTSGLCKISGPDQVISSQVIVSLGESPGYGETGDHRPRVGFFFVRSKDRVADAVKVETRLVHLPKVHALRLNPFPTINKRVLHPIEIFQQSITRLLPSLIRCSSKSESRNAFTVIRRQFEFCSQSNVPIRSGRIFPRHPFVGIDVLPTIANTYISAAHLFESRRTG